MAISVLQYVSDVAHDVDHFAYVKFRTMPLKLPSSSLPSASVCGSTSPAAMPKPFLIELPHLRHPTNCAVETFDHEPAIAAVISCRYGRVELYVARSMFQQTFDRPSRPNRLTLEVAVRRRRTIDGALGRDAARSGRCRTHPVRRRARPRRRE